MNVSSDKGNFIYNTKEEISEHIKRSSALPMDDIWISGENEYPCLSILVNGAYACIHFFEKEDVTWLSYGTYTETVIFLAGGEEWEAPADAVVSVESAILCMEEFFDSMKRPDCIRWQEL